MVEVQKPKSGLDTYFFVSWIISWRTKNSKCEWSRHLAINFQSSRYALDPPQKVSMFTTFFLIWMDGDPNQEISVQKPCFSTKSSIPKKWTDKAIN